jgi:Fis family transcriptional regulator, factor for inversion stimulation protein
MGQKHSYPTSAELDAVVLHMYQAGMSYAEAVREFRKQFVFTALREANWNESKAASVLQMHRNTLLRTVRELELDVRALRKAEPSRVRHRLSKAEKTRQLISEENQPSALSREARADTQTTIHAYPGRSRENIAHPMRRLADSLGDIPFPAGRSRMHPRRPRRKSFAPSQ